MLNVYKQIKFLIFSLFKIFFTKFLNIFIPRDKNYITFYAKILRKDASSQELFMHNTKYFYLFLQNIENKYDYKINWLCDDKNIRRYLNQKGYQNIRSSHSLKGMYYALKSKYWFYDFDSVSFITTFLARGAMIINTWHGIPIKKIAFDNKYEYVRYKNSPKWMQKFEDFLRIFAKYFITNNNYDTECIHTAHRMPYENIIELGSPKLDVLYRDFKDADLLMENDYNAITNLKKSGKKIFIYMPTFRDTGTDVCGWLKSDRLKNFLHQNNAVLVCKLHPIDENSLNFELTEDFYKMDSQSDVYSILKYCDALITDYSSVCFDYLLLDRPILYYVPDLKEYQEQCHDLYYPLEDIIAGAKVCNENELLSAMQDVINGIDNYKDQRKILCNKMFKYKDGHNCERVVEWIKSLNEKGK